MDGEREKLVVAAVDEARRQWDEADRKWWGVLDRIANAVVIAILGVLISLLVLVALVAGGAPAPHPAPEKCGRAYEGGADG
jgi:hypothetical protein